MKNICIVALLGAFLGCLSLEASSGTKKINWDFVRPVLGAGYVAGTYMYGWMNKSVAQDRSITSATSGVQLSSPATTSSSVTQPESGSSSAGVAVGFVGTVLAVGLVNSLRNKIGRAAALERVEEDLVIPPDVELISEPATPRAVTPPQPVVQEEVAPEPSCPVCLDGQDTVMRDGRGRFIQFFACQHEMCRDCFDHLALTQQRDEHGHVMFNNGYIVAFKMCPLCRARVKPEYDIAHR